MEKSLALNPASFITPQNEKVRTNCSKRLNTKEKALKSPYQNNN
jgi:hypothetical protein